jgi:excisionase family DNA binding protein
MNIIKNTKNTLVGPDIIANKLKVHRNTVLNWARNGKIPAIRIQKTYRFSLESVSKALDFELGAA